MLKASQKSQFNKLVKKNALLGAQLPLRSIQSHNVFLREGIYEDKFKHTLDNFAHYEKHIGIFKMNKEHRYNTLSPTYIRDVKRFLTTLHQDDEVKVILMAGAKEQHFCNGTDFRTLHHYAKEKDHDKVVEYLKDLYSLQTLTAKINKPIIAVAHGHAFNSGATFLQATGIPTSTLDSLIGFNEVQFGFVPHGGASYYLSRLPGELGTYLAITGLPMTGIDARLLNLTDMLIHKAGQYKYLLADLMENTEFPLPTGLMYANYDYDIKGEQAKTQHMIDHYDQTRFKELINESSRRSHKNLYHSEFVEPRDRLPETVGQADMRYQMEMYKFDKAQDHYKNRNLGYFDQTSKYFQNYFAYVADYIKGYNYFEFDEGGENLKRHIQAIDRCFYPNTIEEIIDNLKRENTAFANKCLDQINKNSMLSMKLALKMLRQSRNLDYKGCLQNEINVSLNKIQDKDFDLGIKEVLMKPGKHGSLPKFNRNISEDEVNSYFAPNQFTEAVELDIVEKALLPTRQYYSEWSDQVRLWVNEESTPQEEVRRSFDFELKQALHSKGIDIRDRAMDVPTARAYLYHQQQLERLKDNIGQRMEQMATDTRLREQYYEKVHDEINTLQKQPSEFYKMVNQHIQGIFEQAYLNKLQQVYDKSKEIHDLEKRRMFLRFKQFIMRSRIITLFDDKLDKLVKRQNAMPFKQPHLSENWEKSFLLQSHPEIENSIIHHMSKVINKNTISPLEIAKQYISNPQLAQQMTVFTFDQEELQKLRRDILENPSKYEKMLTSKVSETYNEFPERHKAQEIKDDAWTYWYRVLNDGKTPFDNIQSYKRYQVYKEFVDNIEKKAVSTLELCLTRLIQDFEHTEGMNEITEFPKNDKESKRRQLMKLMGTLSDVKLEKEKKVVRTLKNDGDQIIKSSRSLDDIQKLVQNLVKEDQHLKVLIPSNEGLEKNQLVQQFRSELLDKLYTHLEFVLLNQFSNYPVSKEVLQQRLAEATNPQISKDSEQAKRLAQLKIIDQFLSDHNAEQTIKQALQMTKTFFLHEASCLVNQIGKKVLEAFRVDVLASQYLMTYAALNRHSETLASPVVQKLLTFHSERDRQRYIQMLEPTLSLSFYMKNFINMMGDDLYDKNLANSSQKEAMMDAAVKAKVMEIHETKQQQIEQEAQYREEIDRFHELRIKDEVHEFNTGLQLLQDPQMGINDFTVDELNQLIAIDDEIALTGQEMELNMDHLVDEMQVDEWLNVIWALQTQYDVDCRRIFRFGFKQHVLDSMDFDADIKEAMGRQDATFESVAEFAGYIKQVMEAYRETTKHKQNLDNFDKVTKFYMDQHDLLDEVSEQSLFTRLSEQARDNAYGKDSNGSQISKIQKLKENILDFKNIQELNKAKQVSRENIEKLLPSVPQKTQKLVRNMLDSNSPYISLEKIENDLLYRNTENFSQPSKYIDRQKLSRDLSSKDLFNRLMNDYKNLPCDVVSLTVALETVQKQPLSISDKVFDDKFKKQIVHVLQYVHDQCATIPNERRKNITVGEFMKRHQFLNVEGNSLSDVANDLIRNRIERTLGALNPNTMQNENADAASSAALPTEWDYAGHVANPFSHALRNQQIQVAATMGKGVDDNQGIENSLAAEVDRNDMHDFKEFTSRIIDDITGMQHVDETQRLLLDDVLLKALNLVKAKEEFGYVKEKYRSDLLNAYTRSDYTDEEVLDIVNEYTELRFKELMMNKDFVEAIQGPYSTYYLRMLREQIAEDLEIHEDVEMPNDLDFEKFQQLQFATYDAESIHNMADLSNTDAIGFDNIEARAANPDQNRKLAHQTLFDELLAEYFLQKRQQVVNINELMDKLAHKFTPDNDERLRYQPGKDETYDIKDPNYKKGYLTPFELIDGTAVPLAYSRLVQLSNNKDDKPTIDATAFTDLMDLDIATAKALEKGKNGLGPDLQKLDLEDDISIPEYLPMFDVRRPVKDYVDDKLRIILDDIFEIRKRLEKTFTRNELYAYDRVLIKHLTLENLIPRMRTAVEQDKQIIVVHGQQVESNKEGVLNEFKQISKTPNTQKDENDGIINEDSLYKFLAYTAMLEKTRKENIKKNKNDEREAFEINMFDEYYKKQLMKDAKRLPRQIDEKEFYNYKNIPQEAIPEGYIPINERKDVYFQEFQKYKENKKEGYDRNKMFYILEQYFSKTQQDLAKGDQMNDAQKAIVDYFNNTENTEFFMRNKIQ